MIFRIKFNLKIFILCSGIFLSASVSVIGDEQIKVNKNKESISCLNDSSVLEDIKQARSEIDRKNKEFLDRELDLKKRERSVDEEMKKLEGLREEISKIQEKRKSEIEEKVNKLVETFLTMNPKAAAKILGSLDNGLAVETISRLDTKRLAKIMNIMDPVRSSQLSELMVGVDRSKLGKEGR